MDSNDRDAAFRGQMPNQDSIHQPHLETGAGLRDMQMDDFLPTPEPTHNNESANGSLSTSSLTHPSHLELQETSRAHEGSMPPLITVIDDEVDEHSQATQPTPPPVHISTSRRARVDDDEGEEYQRETNRQRLVSPVADAPGDAEHRYHPDMHTHAQEQERQAPPQPSVGDGLPLFSRVAFTVDWFPGRMNITSIVRPHGPTDGNTFAPASFHFAWPPSQPPADSPTPRTATGQPETQNAPGATPIASPTPPPNEPANSEVIDGLRHLQHILGGIPLGPGGAPGPLPPGVHVHPAPPLVPSGDAPFLPFENIFSGMNMAESDDPGRAKRLLSGLEEVPEGLLKRMERLGEEDKEMPVCAVCFDSLLDLVEEEAPANHAGAEHENARSGNAPMDVDSEPTTSTDPVQSTRLTTGRPTDSVTETEVDKSLDHKVFVLPCAHAFHGSCLRPWFTRPHRTTCPTCRFDIDPDSLTYVAPPADARTERIRNLFARSQAVSRAMHIARTVASGNAQAQPGAPEAHPPGYDIAFIPAAPPPPPADAPQPSQTSTNPRPAFVDVPIGIMLDFSMIIPGSRPSAPPATPAHPQTQAAPASGAQSEMQPPTQPPLMTNPAPAAADGASEIPPGPPHDFIQQITRAMFGALEANWPNAHTHATEASASSEPARATSEPPLGAAPPSSSLPPPLQPLVMGTGIGSGPLPAFGVIPVGSQGPLPSFDELVDSVGRDTNEANGNQTQQPQPQSQPQTRDQPPEGHPHDEGLLRQIHHMSSNLLNRLFAHTPAAPGGPGAPRQDTPQGPPAAAQPNGIPQARPQPAGPIPFNIPPPQQRPPPPPKREWAVPPPPGPTLRQRVEKKEREFGLRCSDISCGLGPTDEDPIPVIDPRGVREIVIKPLNDSGNDRVCEHAFHPACLVSAERVAGWNGADQKKEVDEDEESVQVSCPVCRAVGFITREDWDEGACALA